MPIAISKLITDKDNLWLNCIPDREEIFFVVHSFGASKAPRPDGMTGLFYQHYWDIVGDQLSGMVIQFFTSGYLLKQLNHSFIALIPKTNNSSSVSNFRPISLCHVAYKVISKILANQLRQVLPKLIAYPQAAFVSGRSIQENTIVSQEVFRAMKIKRG